MTNSEKNIKLREKILKYIKSQFSNSPLYGRTFFVVLLLAFFLKMCVIYITYKNVNPWSYCFSYMISDFPILLIAGCLVIVNSFISIRMHRMWANLVLFIMLLIFCVDIFTIYYFQSRVGVSERFMFGSSGGKGYTWSIIRRVITLVVGGILLFFLIQKPKFDKNKISRTMIISMSIFLLGCTGLFLLFSGSDIEPVDNIITLNVKSSNTLDLNIQQGKTYYDYIGNQQGENKDLNIILVFAESLSAIDSANAGGNNKMPYFDKMQKDGITFTNFITNGTTSDTAHIATLFGVMPLINIRSDNTPYSGYKLNMQALPEYLNTQGYKTTFISAASLNFLNQRNFLSGAGFQKIIGEEAFKNSKIYTFDAAPDEDLFDRTLQEISAQTGKYFIGLQTISFHKPYNTPYGDTQESALQYSDEQLYKFYQSLKEIGFFDSGILVVVGDHRMMNPAEEGEKESLGSNWYTKSVATVIGSGIQSGTINSNLIQHTDFYNSLKVLVGSGDVPVDITYNNIFTTQANRDRALTNSEVYESNRYTISYPNGETYLFRNTSNLTGVNSEFYDYFSSYLAFEFGDENESNKTGNVKLIGHRGAIDDAPENTLESFLEAKKKGAAGIEFDVSYTKDKQNIVVHGDELYASNCTKTKVQNRTFERITDNCTIKNGEKYRTLKKMLELIDGLFDYYFLEIKVYDEKLGAQQTLEAIQTVKELNMQDRVIFISYSDAARDVLSKENDIIWGRDTWDVGDLDFIGDNSSKYFLMEYDYLNSDTVQKAKSLGKTVVTYTVNNTGEMQDMLNLGVDIILTDDLPLLTSATTQVE